MPPKPPQPLPPPKFPPVGRVVEVPIPLGIAVGRVVEVPMPLGMAPVGRVPPPWPPVGAPAHWVLVLVVPLLPPLEEPEQAASRPSPPVAASATAPNFNASFRLGRLPGRPMRRPVRAIVSFPSLPSGGLG